MLSGLVHRRQAIALRGLEGLDRRFDGPDLITDRGGDRRHRACGFAQCGDGGVDVPEHAPILLEQTFDNQWKTLWIQRICDHQAVLS
ncbi:hypothetical protein [Aeromicrobium sp.]|uniref:hypothetical protein n=1 Tax=Aeromicrobium sp. TaxID=1871063 RepID=UPI003C6FE4DC